MNFIAYILSIKNSNRREHVEELSKKILELGFKKVEIIDAIYWKECDVLNILNELNIELKNYNNISLSQIACFLTHRKSWDLIACKENNLNDIHIILEDDMDISSDFSIEELKKVYDSIHLKDYDSIFLYKHPEQVYHSSNLVHYNEYLLKHYFQWGLCAYSIHPIFAKELCIFNNYLNGALDNQLQNDIFEKKKHRIFYTVKDYFTNLGYLGGNHKEYRFESNIWN
jgi:GR25 family glycosyltransferase involved in LPS biosynthesis